MRALYVYENISFERGKNPRRSLGIAPDPRKQKEAYLNYVANLIPEILGFSENSKGYYR